MSKKRKRHGGRQANKGTRPGAASISRRFVKACRAIRKLAKRRRESHAKIRRELRDYDAATLQVDFAGLGPKGVKLHIIEPVNQPRHLVVANNKIKIYKSTFEMLVQRINDECSKLILGQTMFYPSLFITEL